MTHTRVDIENTLGIIAIFQANPKENHYGVVKIIFGYLKGTSHYGIWYDRSSDFTLSAYTNANWVDSMNDRKSTSGGALFLEARLVSWLRKK